VSGSFLNDGSWIESDHHRGQVDAIVRTLVSDRKQDRLSPERAATEVAGCPKAFPNREQWATASRWPLVQCSTAAEEAIKRGGAGSDGNRHWCRGCWIGGPEKECPDSIHRIKPEPEEVARLVRTLSGAFE